MQLRLGVEISLTVDKQLLGIKEAGGLRERVGKHRPPGRVYLSSGQLPKKDGRGDVQNTSHAVFLSQGLESQADSAELCGSPGVTALGAGTLGRKR